jgi:hypothetical protein
LAESTIGETWHKSFDGELIAAAKEPIVKGNEQAT